MSRKLKVVAVSGSVSRPSRTLVLIEEILVKLGAALPIEVRVIELGQIAPGLVGALARKDLPAAIEEDVAAIEQADLLLVGTPVYRASFTGLFKHLFDFVHHEKLVDVPVLLAATGGSERHALVIDHQLRPLFSFFQALTLPVGVYASEADFTDYQVGSDVLRRRIALAVERAQPFLSHRQVDVAAAAVAG